MPPISVLATRDADFDARLARLLAFENTQDASVDATVAAILDDVRICGGLHFFPSWIEHI